MTRRAIGNPLAGHRKGFLAVSELDRRTIAVTVGETNGTVLTWDLTNRRCLDEFVLPGDVHSFVFGPQGTLVVGFGFDIAVFDARLR